MAPPCTSKSVAQQTDGGEEVSKNEQDSSRVIVVNKVMKKSSDEDAVENVISEDEGDEMSGDDSWSDSSPAPAEDELKSILLAQRPSCSKSIVQRKRKHENSNLRTEDTDAINSCKKLNSESNKTEGGSSTGKEKTKTRCVIPTKDNPPPELHDWLVQFQKWSNAERLLGLDQLIELCNPSQVRHVMQVIEPQFQRDFISLLPKEVSFKIFMKRKRIVIVFQ